ncbi:GNAT family N-acetyltransferase [Vibrio bivalvicida]|uniref:GNAT family N-acetyltransferase n=1 Tax=Vibrio bivalvicida TaxID=1276888 RepID=A0ABV4MI22_9VIBR
MVISFTTARMHIVEIESQLSPQEWHALLMRVPEILTPSVVENLPPYFHAISSTDLAQVWLDRMLSDSRLLQVKSAADEVIGFLFIHAENQRDAHIGYLLAEEYWGKGLASELLKGFIQEVAMSELWNKLIGGVDHSNLASAHLLKKLGFVERDGDEGPVAFYEYAIAKNDSSSMS